MDSSIIYEDNHVLVAIKQQGIRLGVGNSTKDDDNLVGIIKNEMAERDEKKGNVFLVPIFNLDKNTGGIAVFAKSSKSLKRLSKMSDSGIIENKYLSVVINDMNDKHDTLTNYLKIDKERNVVDIAPSSDEKSKKAVSTYKLLSSKTNASLLEVECNNVVPHQIRAQLAISRNPIFGDTVYGGDLVKGWNLALWLFRVKFEHPITQKWLTFICSPPSEDVPWKHFSLDKYLRVGA